jgi:hypothetical protein
MLRLSLALTSLLCAGTICAQSISLRCGVQGGHFETFRRPKAIEVHLTNNMAYMKIFATGNNKVLRSHLSHTIDYREVTNSYIKLANASRSWTLDLRKHEGREMRQWHWRGTITQEGFFRASVKCSYDFETYVNLSGRVRSEQQ